MECAFGILANKWRLLLKTIETDERTAVDIVKCATVLHNVIIDREGIEPLVLQAVQEKVQHNDRVLTYDYSCGRKFNRGTDAGIKIRNVLTEYFSGIHGSVPWNNRYIK